MSSKPSAISVAPARPNPAPSPIEDIAEKVQADVSKYHDYIFIPTVFAMNKSECSGKMLKDSFRNSPEVASVCLNKIQFTFRNELNDQTPIYRVVFDTIEERLIETNRPGDTRYHWFFVYHPEDTWYNEFANHYTENVVTNLKKKLFKRLCCLGNQLDSVIMFMIHMRRAMARVEAGKKPKDKSKHTIQLHLLIPTNRHLVIDSAIKFPSDLKDFVIEAPGRGLVQLCLPKSQCSKVNGIACYTGDTNHRELGTAEI